MSPPDTSFPDGDFQGSSSDSEDEVIGKYQEAVNRSQGLRGGSAGARQQQNGFGWETRQKYSPLTAEYDGYSSEASADDGKLSIHILKRRYQALVGVGRVRLYMSITHG